MFYDFAILVPAATAKADLVKYTLKLTYGIITHVYIEFPAGCRGMVYCTIEWETHQLYPTNPDGAFNSEDYIIPIEDRFPLLVQPYCLYAKVWAPSTTYDHTLTVRVEILEPDVLYAEAKLPASLEKVVTFLGQVFAPPPAEEVAPPSEEEVTPPTPPPPAPPPPAAKFVYVSKVSYSDFTVPPLPGANPKYACNPRDDYQCFEVEVQNQGDIEGECELKCYVRSRGWVSTAPWSSWVRDDNYECLEWCREPWSCCYNALPYRIRRAIIKPGETMLFRGLCWIHTFGEEKDIYIQAKFEGPPGEILSGQVPVMAFA